MPEPPASTATSSPPSPTFTASISTASPTHRPATLDDQIFAHYQDQTWLFHVITERANIELMFNDPYWDRLEFKTDYPFGVLVFNVTTLVSGFHPSEFKSGSDDPYRFAAAEGIKVESLDDYLVVLDRLVSESQERQGRSA